MNSLDSLADGVQHLHLVEMTPPPSDEKAPLSSQKSTSNHSEGTDGSKTAPPTSSVSDDSKTKTAYIESLKEERQHLSQYSDGFNHVFNLIDKEIKRVSGEEKSLSTTITTITSSSSSKDATLSHIIPVPVEKYPDYNFVGRILGPRGTTAKQLELNIGCKVTILGRVKKDGVPATSSESSATADGPLRVQISCPASTPDAAQRIEAGVSVIEALLVPPADGQDELKRQQLMVLANMNGTYRPRTPAAQAQTPPQFSGAGDYGQQQQQQTQFQNLLPYGYRLPVLSKSQHDLHAHAFPQKYDCFNPKCTILRSLIEQTTAKNPNPQLEDVLNVMHMYELMNRIRLANSKIFGESSRQREGQRKAQEIGARMVSSIAPNGTAATSSGSSTSSPRRIFRSRLPTGNNNNKK